MADNDEPKKRKIKKSRNKDVKTSEPDPQENIISESEVQKQTKATFDLLLEQAQANLTRENKSKQKNSGKKKKQKKHDDVILENLKNSGEFQKEYDEQLTKKNTYDPDDRKEKSNKKREKITKAHRQNRSSSRGADDTNESVPILSGADNDAYQPDSPSKTDDGVADEPLRLEELSGGRKRDKKSARNSENVGSEEVKSRKKKLRKKKDDANNENMDPDAKSSIEASQNKTSVFEDDGRITGIIIHRTDKLRTDYFILHPLVRVHIVDSETGLHVSKSDRHRAVTSFYEMRSRDAVTLILPVLTQTFDFKEMHSVIPWWDELLVFNETFNYLIQDHPAVIVFFEVLDFVSMNRAKRNQRLSSTTDGEGGWHKIAWAFLKLKGANGMFNINKQVRLQLYEVPRMKLVGNKVPVFQYWEAGLRSPYPSSLYVTVKSVLPPDSVEPAVRSMFPTQEEHGTMTMREMQEALSKSSKDTGYIAPSNWSRLSGSVCRLPNSLLHSLPAGKMGCITLKFSNDGRMLACGCHDKGSYPVLVYEIPDGQLKYTLIGHYNIIYELCWSQTDKYLLSASSDGTARVWSSETGAVQKMLPHPAFVYCSKFHPRVSKVIVTGGYDSVIRIWQMDGEGSQGELRQELEGHKSYVNSLCFDEEGDKMYSADSAGIIKVWNVYVTDQPSRRGCVRDWSIYSTIVNEEIVDQNITQIMMHSNGRRLLIQTKDNTIRLLDLRIPSVVQRYVGALNFREPVHCDMTPCGTFVFGGSEDGCAYVWNTETGEQVAVYTELNTKHTVNAVAFHPMDHIVAFCARGENQKVLLFRYESQITDKQATMRFTKTAALKEQAEEVQSVHQSAQHALTLSLEIEAKKQRALKQLQTVDEFSQSLRKASTLAEEDDLTLGLVGNSGGWGSSYDTSFQMSGRTVMSPPASSTRDEALRNHHMAYMEYMRRSPTSGWRGGFSPNGTATAGQHQVMNIVPPSPSKQNTSFTFQGAEMMKPIEQVVALSNYKAQRSDELTFSQGDTIAVLYKDTPHWWMGRLYSGAHGFFPSNCVTPSSGALPSVSPLDGILSDNSEDVVDESSKRTHAVVDKAGQLRFLSETESDGDALDIVKSSKHPKRREKGLLKSGNRSRSRERRRNRIADSSSMSS